MATLRALLPTVPCRVVLAVKLSVEVSLLRTRTPGPGISVWVTARCRCRLLEKPWFVALIGVLSTLGPLWINLVVRVTLSVR